MTDRLVHGGDAERRNTKDEHAMLPDYLAIMPMAAVGPAKFFLRSAQWLWTHWRSAVVIGTVRCQLRVPSCYLRQSGFASTARRPGAHRCTGASRTEDDRLRAGKGNGKPIARPKGPPSGMSLSEKDTSASCPKARAARRCHNGCNCTVGSPKRRRANAVAPGVNVSCGRLAASC